MFFYTICQQTIQSNVPMPELAPVNGRQPGFTFQLCAGAKGFSEPRQWLNHWYSLDGAVWLAFARLETGYLLRFPDLADFVVSSDARRVYCYLAADCPLETMRHLLLNQVIPIVLSHAGKLVLHASACATEQGAVAFMGMSGAGKSTLAASFGLRGWAVLSDDCVLVGQQDGLAVTVPSYPGLRLWPEGVAGLFAEQPELASLAHYTDKKRLLLDHEYLQQEYSARPHSLRAIYVLTQAEDEQDTSDVTITRLGTSEALLAIVKHTFQLDITDRQKLGEAFRNYEWLARAAPFFRLAFPREHAYLPKVHDAILNQLKYCQTRQQIAA